MKFSLFALAAVLNVASAFLPEFAVDSPIGQRLLSQARRVEEEYDWETAMAWIAGYSVKFQGCHSIKQWNGDADEDNDVKISTKRLVRFRLCPAESCSASKAAGCTSGYGDYIIDMDLFMQSYMQGKQTEIEYQCKNQLYNVCSCNDDDGKGDDFNAEYCEFDCYNDAGMTQCIENNPYEDNGDNNGNQQQYNLEEFMECKEVKANNNRRRKLDQEEQVQYYVGPYCAGQGGAIKLGLFTDDSCTTATNTSFYDIAGYNLPYSGEDESIVDMDCIQCIEKQDAEEAANQDNNGNGADDDAADADTVGEMCESLYQYAGKCEANLPSGMNSHTNNNACTYMEGIRIVRQDGIIDTGSSRPSAVATSFIVIFAVAFAAMAFYVWYLRTRLGVKKNTLL